MAVEKSEAFGHELEQPSRGPGTVTYKVRTDASAEGGDTTRRAKPIRRIRTDLRKVMELLKPKIERESREGKNQGNGNGDAVQVALYHG